MLDLSLLRFCHTEHEIHRFAMTGVRIFRCPSVYDRECTLQEIEPTDARVGDLILAIALNEHDSAPTSIPHLSICRVMQVEDDTLHVEANVIVGCGSDSQYVHDRVAGLLGL